MFLSGITITFGVDTAHVEPVFKILGWSAAFKGPTLFSHLRSSWTLLQQPPNDEESKETLWVSRKKSMFSPVVTAFCKKKRKKKKGNKRLVRSSKWLGVLLLFWDGCPCPLWHHKGYISFLPELWQMVWDFSFLYWTIDKITGQRLFFFLFFFTRVI